MKNEEIRYQWKKFIEKYNKYFQIGLKYSIRRGRRLQKKRFENPEEIQKLSEAQKKRYENPEERQKHSEALIAYYKNPEARQKIVKHR